MKILYKKVFMSGPLTGCTVHCGFPVIDTKHADFYVGQLKKCTSISPGRDMITKHQYYVEDVRVEGHEITKEKL